MSLRQQIARRRTFAIISHPDAGKTTLTEKFLLYGGAVQLAGTVTARKNQRATTSDWMELEKKRGISISSTVLQFEYQNYAVNILDTPGHRDFSEDTYRVLTAVDAVIMVVDAGKGIEAQTRKLFEICRRREIPIFTFMNKLDRPGLEPLELIDELESVLGIKAFPANWPLGMGEDFRGVYDRLGKCVHLFERVPGGSYRAPVAVADISDPLVREKLRPSTYTAVTEELEMLDGAGATFDRDEVLSGKLTPVFFGSASNNFGIQLLLDAFLEHSTEPRARKSKGEIVPTDTDSFSGFVFKIQANMDPKHRDRIAFIRICSGRFNRDLPVIHTRTGKKIRLSSSHKLFGQDRETVDEAFAGDIIGVIGHSDLGIGDTVTEDTAIEYDEIPTFAPECFAYLHNSQALQSKRFQQGLDQLLQEGVVQVLYLKYTGTRRPVLAAVGPLQFEVVQYRLESEYGAIAKIEHTNWTVIRWLPSEIEGGFSSLKLPTGGALAEDVHGNTVVLLADEWAERFFASQNPKVELQKEAPR
ncbi:MAG: peptide chain release factor 3 [Deltaproteobacteria bacterium]|nr:peptide chain release factor 3 [Deltaproteobacteria bacterium]